jgi:hypothetical protein
VPKPPPEAELIARRRTERVPRMSRHAAARLAGISETRWRQLETGRIIVRGRELPETAPAETLAKMAYAVGVTQDELADTGRLDAAVILKRLIDQAPPDAARTEVRALVERIGRDRRMSPGQQARVVQEIMQVIGDVQELAKA